MTSVHSPARLSAAGSEAPASLRSALSAAVRHQPSSEELAHIALSLSPHLNAPRPTSPAHFAPSQPSVAPRPGGWWSGSGSTMGKAGVFLAGTAALLLTLPRMWSAAHPVPLPAPEVSAITDLRTSEPVRHKLEEPSPPSVEPDSLAPDPQPTRGPARELRSKPRSLPAPAVATATPAAAAFETQESEVQLLERARRLLQANPRQTLDLVREHERRFASGALAQEREIVAIEALERLGRGAEARSREETFRARYPSSVHGNRIEVPSGRP